MNILLAFAPFLVFALVDRFVSPVAGLTSGALVAAALVVRDMVSRNKKVKVLEVGIDSLWRAGHLRVIWEDAVVHYLGAFVRGCRAAADRACPPWPPVVHSRCNMRARERLKLYGVSLNLSASIMSSPPSGGGICGDGGGRFYDVLPAEHSYKSRHLDNDHRDFRRR